MTDNLYDKKKQLESLNCVSDLNHIVNEAYRILGHPMVVYDTSYNLMAYTENIITDDPIWNEFVTLKTLSHETVDFCVEEHFISAYAESEIVSMLKSDKLKYDRMNGKVFDKDNVQLGDVTVVACMKPFEDGDAELIEILSEILSVALQNSEFYPSIERVYQESLLSDILTGKATDYPEVISELYDGLKNNLYLAVVDISQYERTVTHLAYFTTLFRRMQPEYKYFIHLSNLIIIVSTDDEWLNIKKDMAKLNEFFTKYNVYAGISGKFQDLKKLNKYYREAINALNYGLKSMRKQNIFSYDYYRIEHFLHVMSDSAEKEGIYHPIVSNVQEYDMKNGTSLKDTLYIYLLYGGNIESASKAAGKTPAKIKKHLKTLEDFFDIDWKNGDMLSSIFISIKMINDVE